VSIRIITIFVSAACLYLFFINRWLDHWNASGGNPLRLIVSELVNLCVAGVFLFLAVLPGHLYWIDRSSRTTLAVGMRIGLSRVKRSDSVSVELRTKDGSTHFRAMRVLALPGDRVEMHDGVFVRNDIAAPSSGTLFPKPNGTIFPGVVPAHHVVLAWYDPFDSSSAKAHAQEVDFDKRFGELFGDVKETMDATCILVRADALVARYLFEL
jgi:hypothetical protein